MNRFTRLHNGVKQRFDNLRDTIGIAKGAKETWLFVSPHDDDLVIGSGLWIDAAVKEGIDVQVIVVTDGRMGYCTLKERNSISRIRRKETYESFKILGVGKDQIAWCGFPDGGLYPLQGRRKASRGDEKAYVIKGYTGLCNSFVYHLRRTKPARVFVPTIADLHPDHQVTNNEMLISLFHGAGEIWPELGKPLVDVPKVYELAIYCDFPQPPQFELNADASAFETKLKGIAAYKSQKQITRLVESIRNAGPYEYLRELNFRFYSPTNHKKSFA